MKYNIHSSLAIKLICLLFLGCTTALISLSPLEFVSPTAHAATMKRNMVQGDPSSGDENGGGDATISSANAGNYNPDAIEIAMNSGYDYKNGSFPSGAPRPSLLPGAMNPSWTFAYPFLGVGYDTINEPAMPGYPAGMQIRVTQVWEVPQMDLVSHNTSWYEGNCFIIHSWWSFGHPDYWTVRHCKGQSTEATIEEIQKQAFSSIGDAANFLVNIDITVASYEIAFVTMLISLIWNGFSKAFGLAENPPPIDSNQIYANLPPDLQVDSEQQLYAEIPSDSQSSG